MNASSSAFEYQHAPLPLPLDAGKLNGLSERLIQSHWQNNYGGAIKALNFVRSRLFQALLDEKTPPYVYNALKREQLIRTGSVVLHELYFANLGGDGKAPGDLRPESVRPSAASMPGRASSARSGRGWASSGIVAIRVLGYRKSARRGMPAGRLRSWANAGNLGRLI